MQWADQLTQELLIREPATRVQFRCWIPECLVVHHSCTQVTQILELFHHGRDPASPTSPADIGSISIRINPDWATKAP